MKKENRKLIKLFSNFLIIYGAQGIICVLIIFFSSLGSLKILKEPIQEEFIIMSRSMKDASVSSKNAANSIRNAKNSLYLASNFSKSAAGAFSTISIYVGFEIVGWRPFKSAYNYFIEGGNNLKQLSIQLTKTSDSLEVNAQDMERLSNNFEDMSLKLQDVSFKFNTLYIHKLATILVVYICLLQIIFVLIGVSFLKIV